MSNFREVQGKVETFTRGPKGVLYFSVYHQIRAYVKWQTDSES